MAVFGSTVVMGWDDIRQGPLFSSLTGYGFSTDGGATFTDGGQPSFPPGFQYLGDTSLAVNRDGHFYFASLILDPQGIQNIAVS